MIISLDTECTGLDFAHGAMPFLVTTCDDTGVIRFWEWDVDPLTRKPLIPDGDVEEIQGLIDAAKSIYLQNAKFDCHALASIGVTLPWHKVHDTLVMGHLLATNHKHDLTSMCVEYLGVNIEKYEIDVKEVTKLARVIAKKNYPHWKLADEGVEDMPSVKSSTKHDEDKPWKNDMWLPRALIKAGLKQYIPVHWSTTTSAYANTDSETTLPLGLELERLIKERGLEAIYKHRMRLPEIAYGMESYGVTVIGEYTESTINTYSEYVAEASYVLKTIAEELGHDLKLAEGAALNDSMREFFYGSKVLSCPNCKYVKHIKHWNGESISDREYRCPKCMNKKKPVYSSLKKTFSSGLQLPVIISPKTRNATLDKEAMQHYLRTLEPGPALDFIRILTDKRKHDTDLSYMQSYRRFWVPEDVEGYYRIHASLNPCATDHLRWASRCPNLQNVGNQEDKCEECEGEGCSLCGFTGKTRTSVRACFGPLPYREWWSMDYRSIERLIPAYESGEPKMVEVFEHPDQPPYWGSLYLLTASVLYPDKFWPLSDKKDSFKSAEPRLYKQAKFFDLAKQYGCGRKKGDLLSKVFGSFDIVDQEFPLLAKLQRYYLRQAETTGYVETLPDITVDSEHGYPILASRTDDGRVLSTTPFNYHVSGTACWCKNAALIRCADQLAVWRKEGFDGHIALEIHDEILFDFPRGKTWDEHLPKVMVLKSLMEQSGRNLIPSMPTPVSVKYHDKSWDKGKSI